MLLCNILIFFVFFVEVLHTMEKELIETFLIIAKVNNISKASKMLYVSQATVSYRLKLLEKKLGTPLIQRSKGTRQTLLTTNGRRFLPLAQSWLDMDNALINFAQHKESLELKVGSTNSINNYLLRAFFEALGRNEKKWKITIRTTHTASIYEELRLNEMDLGLCLEEKLEPGISTKLLYSEPGYGKNDLHQLRPQFPKMVSALRSHRSHTYLFCRFLPARLETDEKRLLVLRTGLFCKRAIVQWGAVCHFCPGWFESDLRCLFGCRKQHSETTAL